MDADSDDLPFLHDMACISGAQMFESQLRVHVVARVKMPQQSRRDTIGVGPLVINRINGKLHVKNKNDTTLCRICDENPCNYLYKNC